MMKSRWRIINYPAASSGECNPKRFNGFGRTIMVCMERIKFDGNLIVRALGWRDAQSNA